MSLSERLKQELERRNWTTSHLVVAMAEHGCKVSEAAVYMWIKGQRTPRAEYLPALARALGTTPNDLLGFEAAEPAGAGIEKSQ